MQDGPGRAARRGWVRPHSKHNPGHHHLTGLKHGLNPSRRIYDIVCKQKPPLCSVFFNARSGADSARIARPPNRNAFTKCTEKISTSPFSLLLPLPGTPLDDADPVAQVNPAPDEGRVRVRSLLGPVLYLLEPVRRQLPPERREAVRLEVEGQDFLLEGVLRRGRERKFWEREGKQHFVRTLSSLRTRLHRR